MKKKIIIITTTVIIILVLFYLNRVTNLSIDRVDGIEQFFESRDESNNLYGITEDGDIYSFNYRNTAELIIEQSEIIFYKKNRDISLIINKDGSIYLDETGGFGGKLIGKIEGAVRGDTTTIHTAIVTDKGQLFMYGNNMYGGDEYNILGTGEINKLEEFQEIPILNNITQVIFGCANTYVLTKSGDIFMSGEEGNLRYTKFQKFDTTEKIINICGNENSVFALSQQGEVYEFGYLTLRFRGGLFDKVENLEEIGSISVASSNAAGLTKDGELYCWGRDIYKRNTMEYMEPTKIGNFSDAVEIYCTEDYIYVISKDNIICVPFNRENKLLRLINTFNIFYGGEK